MIRQSQSILFQLYALVDFISIQVAFLIAYWLKFISGWIDHDILIAISNLLDVQLGLWGYCNHRWLLRRPVHVEEKEEFHI